MFRCPRDITAPAVCAGRGSIILVFFFVLLLGKHWIIVVVAVLLRVTLNHSTLALKVPSFNLDSSSPSHIACRGDWRFKGAPVS